LEVLIKGLTDFIFVWILCTQIPIQQYLWYAMDHS